MNRDEIIKQGFLDVKVSVSGLRQAHRLNITIENEVPVLVSKNYIPTPELLRIAQMSLLPVRHKETLVFPPGMAAGDFKKKDNTIAQMVSEPIEAVIEDE